MEEFLHVLLHALTDTAKMLPFLFLIYFLIEYLEYKNVFKFQKSNLLKGKASPVMGALFGSVPQCGFSVISSELYTERKISIGALIAVYIATSDEALPIMLADYKSIPSLLLLTATKILLAILIGYISMFFYNKIFKKKPITVELHDSEHKHEHNEEDEHHDEEHEHIHACCGHDTESSKFNWKHPIIHCVKIALYVLLISIVMGAVIEFVGEDKLTNFLSSSNICQPLFALIIGLIPNCASSVILTELYLMGGLSFGAIVTGLSVNAGIGFLLLLKQNKNIKENIFILLMLIVPSLLIGYVLHFLPLGFLLI